MKKIALWACAIVLIYAFMFVASPAIPSQSTRSTSNKVLLRAAPGNTVVQMFDTLRDGPDVNVTTFPDGWGCTQLGGLTSFEGMNFYKLDCGTKTGYVNAQWVR